MTLFCIRCGAENPSLARHCGDCGAMLEESEAPPVEVTSEPDAGPLAHPAQCVRCGAFTGEADHCPTCGSLQPLLDHEADPFLTYALARYPELLRSPRLTTKELPFRGDLRGVVMPAVGIALAAMLADVLVLAPTISETGPVTTESLTWTVLKVGLLAPFLFLAYCAVLQGLVMMVGGRGSIERTVRTLAMLWIPTLILLGGWGHWFRLTERLLEELAVVVNTQARWMSPFMPAYPLLMPLCQWGGILTFAGGLVVQCLVLAYASWMETWRSVVLHLVLLAAAWLWWWF